MIDVMMQHPQMMHMTYQKMGNHGNMMNSQHNNMGMQYNQSPKK